MSANERASHVRGQGCVRTGLSRGTSCSFPRPETGHSDDGKLPQHAPSASQGDSMNLAKVVVSLGFILVISLLWTACGGGKSNVTPPAGAPTIQTAQLPQGAVNEVYGIN